MHISKFSDHFFEKVRIFRKASERIRTRPDASERIGTHPNRSERLQTGPHTSESLEKLARTLNKTSKNFFFRETCEIISPYSEGS